MAAATATARPPRERPEFPVIWGRPPVLVPEASVEELLLGPDSLVPVEVTVESVPVDCAVVADAEAPFDGLPVITTGRYVISLFCKVAVVVVGVLPTPVTDAVQTAFVVPLNLQATSPPLAFNMSDSRLRKMRLSSGLGKHTQKLIGNTQSGRCWGLQ